ncbi:MAG TPA: DUF4124 domain-containing protein [Usitatibacter sp.]|nr:DUF4124 domain-containing protein [Usitatibacter sp.]
MPHAAPRRALALVSLLASCACLAAWGEGMYKWVDEKGVTHYSESPPPEGTASKKLEVKAGEGKEADWHKKLQDYNQQKLLKEQAERQQAAKEQGNRQAQCKRAQEALDTLNNSRRVYHLDDKGQRVYVDDEQRQKEIEMWQERARSAC